MRTYSLKYVELAEKHAEQMAKRWATDVQNNPKTPAYKSLNEQKILSQCIWFYHQFSRMFIGEKITEEAQKYFRSYAEESYAMGIPMAEALYALTLMRRHIWLYADFQMIFSSDIERQQALETLNRTIVLFDYATYEITEQYQKLMKTDRVDSKKVLDVVESNIVEIAGAWADAVRKDKRTIAYHHISKDKLIPQAIKFYSQLRSLLFDPYRFEKGHEFFRLYAENSINSGIPLHEVVYALNMMRRHMWLHTGFQKVFIESLAYNRTVDGFMRMILLMDYAVFDITHYYQEHSEGWQE